MTIPSDPDQAHDAAQPVVHTSRRAALQAERADAARAIVDARAARTVRVTRAVRTAEPAHPRSAPAPRTRTAVRSARARTSRMAMTGAAAAFVLFAVSAVPAHASSGAAVSATTIVPPARGQDYAVTAAVVDPDPARDTFTVSTRPVPPPVTTAAVGGLGTTASVPGLVTAGSGEVRSPFPGPVRMSSGFGYRVAPCAACSSMHQGLDFTPGSGAPIGAVAAGTVRVAGMYGQYGQAVVIDHVVDGQKVSTLSAHMIVGSSPVVVGQRVAVGQYIGQVGSSGVSTGAHLHFEVQIGGVPVDPAVWLVTHTGRAL